MKRMINHRISADWVTNKLIAAFSCKPYVQEVHTKAEVVTSCIRGVQENAAIGLVVLQSAEILGLII